MQTDIAVDGNAITGTLNFIEGGLSPSGSLSGDGYFMALKFSDPDERTTSIKVGLDPTKGSGLVELDEDMNAVFKVDTKDGAAYQKLKVVQEGANRRTTQTFDLSGLTLDDTGA